MKRTRVALRMVKVVDVQAAPLTMVLLAISHPESRPTTMTSQIWRINALDRSGLTLLNKPTVAVVRAVAVVALVVDGSSTMTVSAVVIKCDDVT
jgi:hypothetical protein